MIFRNKALTCCAATAALIFAGAPARAGDNEVYVTAPGTVRTFQQTFLSMDRHCRSLPMPKLSIVEPPAYGRIGFGVGRAHPDFDASSGRAHCNRRIVKSPGIVYYAPARPVDDTFVVRVRFSDGEVRFKRYNIQVR